MGDIIKNGQMALGKSEKSLLLLKMSQLALGKLKKSEIL
jgi:hypothetical protein